MVWNEVNLAIRSASTIKIGIDAGNEVENRFMEIAMWETHSTCFEVLILLCREVMGENAPAKSTASLKDVVFLSKVAKKRGSVEAGHTTTNDSDLLWWTTADYRLKDESLVWRVLV